MMVDFLLQVGQIVVSGLFSVFAFWGCAVRVEHVSSSIIRHEFIHVMCIS
jgi:hypothetical protein